jgi:hypothetical protein
MYYFTSETIAQANMQISYLDAKVGGLLCILSCIDGEIEENQNYTINGTLLRKQLSMVFDKTPRDSFDHVKSSYIIFAKDWVTTFFKRYIKIKMDLTACAVFFLRRNGFERECTEEEVVKIFIDRFNLKPLAEQWFFEGEKIELEYNQTDVEDNQSGFYYKMKYNNDFKSILFNSVIQKSAADLKAAGQIQTLYSGSGIQTCFLLSDEPLDHYYIMRNSNNSETKEDEDISSDVLNHKLFGIHIKEKNTALSEENPHICIGWSVIGDLSSVSTKEELADIFAKEWPEAKSRAQGQNVGQVWRFVNDMQIGDYVVFADGNVFHIGKIESDYYYDDSIGDDQSSDYKNSRKVVWLKKNIQRSEISDSLHHSLMTAMSVWTMNDYRAAIADLLNGAYIKDQDDTETEIENSSIRFSTGYQSKFARNRIVFGAPGTGKSFTINKERKELLGSDNETDYERVTFHPDYSYANFVGTYKPIMVDDSAEIISLATEKDVIAVLTDETKSAQEKYDLLYDRFKGDGLTRLPLLLGLYTDEGFKTRRADGSDTVGDNSVERNHGKAIRPYVSLSKPLNGKKDISYEYVPGPFMRMYVKALKNSRTDNIKPFLLIIEEINRANVAAVFGDVFQLLDRGNNFVSEYPIQATEDIKKYLAKELGGNPDDYNKIKIPDNMFIWATMNSADQGVFPMDTAFKRRWNFTYLGINDSDKDIQGKYVEVGSIEKQRIDWNSLRKAINDYLASEKINEDKQLGPYFISRDIVVPNNGNEIDSKRFCDVFKHKVLMYLFDDAAKQKRNRLFEGYRGDKARYSEICKGFDEQGIGIFNAAIQNKVEVVDLVTNNIELDENGMPKSEE